MVKVRRNSALLCSAFAAGLYGCAGTGHKAPEAEFKVVPKTTESAAASPSDSLYLSAVAAVGRRDYATALELLQAARERSPDDARVLNAFGVVYDKLGRFDLSSRYYAQAQAADPGSQIVAENLAYSRVLQGETTEKTAVAALTPSAAAAAPSPAEKVALAAAAPAPSPAAAPPLADPAPLQAASRDLPPQPRREESPTKLAVRGAAPEALAPAPAVAPVRTDASVAAPAAPPPTAPAQTKQLAAAPAYTPAKALPAAAIQPRPAPVLLPARLAPAAPPSAAGFTKASLTTPTRAPASPAPKAAVAPSIATPPIAAQRRADASGPMDAAMPQQPLPARSKPIVPAKALPAVAVQPRRLPALLPAHLATAPSPAAAGVTKISVTTPARVSAAPPPKAAVSPTVTTPAVGAQRRTDLSGPSKAGARQHGSPIAARPTPVPQARVDARPANAVLHPAAMRPVPAVAVRGPATPARASAPARRGRQPVTMGKPVKLVYSASQRRTASQLQFQLGRRGWTLASFNVRSPTAGRSVIRYEPAQERIAFALARSVGIPVKMERCLHRCTGVTLVLGERRRTVAGQGVGANGAQLG